MASQAEHLSAHRSGCGDEDTWVLHTKIYIAGVLADEMEAAYNWIAQDKGALLYFK